MERNRNTRTVEPKNRVGFTLVELLVVITIIGILAALITAAGAGALKRARQAKIKTEIDQIAMALQTYKDTAGSYPPNSQTDDTNLTPEPPTSPTPINETQVVSDIKRHMSQAFGKSREPAYLINALAGMSDGSTPEITHPLPGGMSAGEALVFWLGGFSSDEKYPISGEGGPSYAVIDAIRSINIAAGERREHDALERKWTMPFAKDRLLPKATDNFFDDSAAAGERYLEYQVIVNGQPQTRRINFWQYVPSQSERPYLYFDTSRHEPETAFDPPAAASPNPNALHVHAVKMRSDSTGAALAIQFANRDKFQILHSGIDEEWGESEFEKMSLHPPNTPANMLLYPNGPFTGEVADTLTNFSEGTLEASQP